MSTTAGLLLTVGLLLVNAFFVGAEFALISARRTIVEPKALAGSRSAQITLKAMENVSLMMAGAQLGITICSLALGALSEPAIASLLEGPFAAMGVPDAFVHPIAFAIALSLVTYLHVVFGEMVPKNIALAGPERMAMLLAPPLVAIVTVLFPLLWVMNAIANAFLRLMKVEPKNEVTSVFTRDEVAALVEESRHGGMLDVNDEKLLLGALTFAERDVSSVLIPVQSLTTLATDVTPAQAEAVAIGGFSRFPVRAADGLLVGYVHIKDLLEIEAERRDLPMDPALMRTLPDVRMDMPLRQALTAMQGSGAHLARAIDANGVTLGILTLEDVLEELVGQIRDDSRSLKLG
ncbi:HlyC/CorC family transporter [Cryobacterium frigoriphilum]|uniref:HlyC/CorC family transporter n=1 Tax=Cryobacterium frigoriphilum TaxID=1259150 RepID=A0A4R9A6G2_9MICO|nr:hemolysin family protein [Cryobacterium frigoriphilum]TFD52947.1 HlyC/CorC family transporter [Cryobacterium frigoriphilum]